MNKKIDKLNEKLDQKYEQLNNKLNETCERLDRNYQILLNVIKMYHPNINTAFEKAKNNLEEEKKSSV